MAIKANDAGKFIKTACGKQIRGTAPFGLMMMLCSD